MDHRNPQDNGLGEEGKRPLKDTTTAERWRLAAERALLSRTPVAIRRRLANTLKEKYLSPHARFSRVRKRALLEFAGRAEVVADDPFRSTQAAGDEETYEQDQASAGLEASVERSSHFILDARQRSFLADLLKMRFPPVKIYANQASNAVARAYKAEALTYGDRILFRSGKFNPQSPEGLALLGHELTHAAQSKFEDRPGVIRSSQHYDRQEREALQHESILLSHLSQPLAAQRPSVRSADTASPAPRPMPQRRPRHEMRSPTAPSSPHVPRQAAMAQPKAALEDRRASPAEAGMLSPGSSELSESQMRLIKEEVYRDLMDRIRTEFERGG